jgi:arylsulfatase A-like enzyme
MSLYGNPVETTPNLDGWAQEATVFDHAYSVSAWTAPGLVSILAGVLPGVHGVDSRDRHTQESLPTLLKLFQHQGYQVPNLNFFTFAPYYQDLGLPAIDRSYFTQTDGDELLNYLERNADRPFFIWYHTTKVHQPYNPPDDVLKKIMQMVESRRSKVESRRSKVESRKSKVESRNSKVASRRSQVSGQKSARNSYRSSVIGHQENPHAIDWEEAFKAPGIQAVRHGAIVPKGSVKFQRGDLPALLALYDGEIYNMDLFFGRVLDKLREKGLEERTLVIVTADHGEEMLEHGFVGHASTSLNAKLYEELTHIPLVFHLPGQKTGARVSGLVQQIDIAPTLLDLMGLPVPEIMQGRSLKGAVSSEQVAGRKSQAAGQEVGTATGQQPAGKQEAGGRRQEAAGSRQTAGESRQEAGSGRQKAEGGRQKAEGGRQGAERRSVFHPEILLESSIAGNQTTKEREDLWLRGLRTKRFKYIQELKGATITKEYLFDLNRDPREEKNLLALRKLEAARFRRRVTEMVKQNQALRQKYLPAEALSNIEGRKSKVAVQVPCPVVEMPEPEQTLDYRLHTGAMLFQWRGDPNSEYVIEYDIGLGDHHVAGQYEAKGNYQILGPFPPELWVSLKAWNPFKIRVAYKGTQCWSAWRTFYF